MTEIPYTSHANTSSTPEEPVQKPEEYSDWLEKHPEPPATPPPLSYELNISPNATATVKIEQMPESYFDRRHEALDENKQSDQSTAQGMVPLGQVLADHPTQQAAEPVKPSSKHSTKLPSIKPNSNATLSSSTYRRALISGLLGGLVAAAVFILLVLK